VTRRDAFLLVALGAAWGAVYPLNAVVLRDLPTPAVVALRAGFAAAVLLPVAWRRGVLSRVRQHLWAVFVGVLLQSTFPLVLMTVGQEHVDSGLAGVVIASQPVWAAVITSAVAHYVSGAEVMGVLVGLGGVGLIFARDLDVGGTSGLAGGALLGAAVLFAAGSVYVERVIPEVPGLAVAAAAMVVSSVALAPFALASDAEMPGWGALVRLMVLGIGATGSALVLFYALIRRIGAVKANLGGYLAPGFAVVSGAIFLDEAVTPASLVGLGLIVGGSYLAARHGASPRCEAPEPAGQRP
jgi:drug/metabolite transporter (DMT)-like permease